MGGREGEGEGEEREEGIDQGSSREDQGEWDQWEVHYLNVSTRVSESLGSKRVGETYAIA
jgi:hypothetical protein